MYGKPPWHSDPDYILFHRLLSILFFDAIFVVMPIAFLNKNIIISSSIQFLFILLLFILAHRDVKNHIFNTKKYTGTRPVWTILCYLLVIFCVIGRYLFVTGSMSLNRASAPGLPVSSMYFYLYFYALLARVRRTGEASREGVKQ